MSGSIADRINYFVGLSKDFQAEAERLEKELKEANKRITDIARVDLPEMMREGEVTELKLSDGTKVKLSEKVSAKIAEANRAEAMTWLVDNGFGGLIKTFVTVQFDPQDHKKAERLQKQLNKRFPNAVQIEQNVHASTLRAFIEERLEVGEKIPPFDVFGVFQYSEVKVTPPK